MTPIDSQKPTTENISPWVDILVPLRAFLLRFVGLFSLAFVGAWMLRRDLTGLVRWPLVAALPQGDDGTVLLRVIDAFMVHVKLCFYVALLLVVPYLAVFIWSEVRRRTGVTGRWNRLLVPLSAISLFFVGVSFCYWVVLPAAFGFLVQYSVEGGGVIVPSEALGAADLLQVSMREHVDFTMKLLIAFGVGFESPLIMGGLARLGVVSSAQFAAKRGVALVGMAVVASIMTPPDPWTMMLLLGPLMLLYEIGIWTARVVGKQRDDDSESSDREETKDTEKP